MGLPNIDEMQAEVDNDQAMLLMKRAVVDQMKDVDDRMKAAAQAWQVREPNTSVPLGDRVVALDTR